MKSRWVRALGWLILFIVVLGISLPFVSADRFREPLRSALENALGRKVTLGRMHWNLFTGPGLRADDVTIAEDPALGNEPIAYAGSLIATPSISSLWHRRLECSSLRLEDTHVNVARSGDAANATWNFSMLARPRLLAAFPAIRLRGARVNFRMNQVKNVFYLLDTDLDIEPVASDGSDWRVHIKGQPARTDRPGRGFGSFEATARWKVQPARTGVLDLTATLENSEISDILQLLRGDDFGLQGHVAGQLTLKGEPAALALQGALRMDQLHGWEQVPPSGEAWRFNLNGTLNSIAQDMDVNATAPGAAPVLQAHLRLSRYLAGPRWGIQATLHQMPLDSLVDVARHLGSPIPTGTRLSGTADGALGYSQSEGFEGAVQIANARMTLPKAVPVEMATARVITTGDQVLLRPTTVTVGTETAAINATYLVNSDELQVNLGSKSIAYDALEKGAQALGVPVLAEVQGGHWSGELHFVRKSASAGWLGNMRLTGARLNVPGMASAVALENAEIEIQPAGLVARNLHATAAGIPIEGDYSYVGASPHPHVFHLTLGAADAAILEREWLPALKRQNLLDRALGRMPQASWLTNWHADGTLQFGALTLAGVDLRKLRTHVIWDENLVTFDDLKARAADGDFAGIAHVDLSGALPVYSADLRLYNAEWKGGRANCSGKLNTSGIGPDTGKHMSGTGTFEARELSLAALENADELAGQYEVLNGALETHLKASGPSGTYAGSGRMGGDGRMPIRLRNGDRQLQITVTFDKAIELISTPIR